MTAIGERNMDEETLDWLDSYYEALEFFYWEPQHLRAKTDATVEAKKLAEIAEKSTRVEQVTSHLRKMEVTLNHNFKQFFPLAPDAFRNNLFDKLFGPAFTKPFDLQGRGVDKKFALANSMQPDFLFISEDEVVSIEMKIKHKCEVDQVLKYALLGLAVEIQQKKQKEHYLVLLGAGAIANQFRERFKSIDDLTDAIKSKNLDTFLKNKPPLFQDQERLKWIVQHMTVQFLSYKDLTDILRSASPQQADQSAGAEVFRKLIDGLCHEISRRKLS
jgi:hypothetical protein